MVKVVDSDPRGPGFKSRRGHFPRKQKAEANSQPTAQAANMVADQVLIPGAVYGNGGMSELQYATTLSNIPGLIFLDSTTGLL